MTEKSETDKIGSIIDEIWMGYIKRLMKKEITPIRPSIGDEIDLSVPQIKTLLLAISNPLFPTSIYTSSHISACRNAHLIMRRLGMPPDYFWKFEYWTNERAFETLGKVTNRIFAEMMNISNEGHLSLKNVSIDPKKLGIELEFEECAECYSLEIDKPVCYYHAGLFAGILSSLVGKELDAYETDCHAIGSKSCIFLITQKEDEREALEDYLSAPGGLSIENMLKRTLDRKTARSMGNDVGLRYYQLLALNSIATNPKMIGRSSYEVGGKYGKKLASFLKEYYAVDDLTDAIPGHYKALKQMSIKDICDGRVCAQEVAEISELPKDDNILGFLFGELEGIISEISMEKLEYADNQVEGGELIINFKKG
ncbi:MAG: 4-vinyl reductase [Halobacteriota archaeon]|nr:4-vinyl reductase [Halobacteriota archaeon]